MCHRRSTRIVEQGGQAWRHVRDDAMRLGLRDREHGGQLANRQVGAERDTCHEHASLEGLRPTMTSPLLGCSKSYDDVVQLVGVKPASRAARRSVSDHRVTIRRGFECPETPAWTEPAHALVA
jgi:hypothetical protein